MKTLIFFFLNFLLNFSNSYYSFNIGDKKTYPGFLKSQNPSYFNDTKYHPLTSPPPATSCHLQINSRLFLVPVISRDVASQSRADPACLAAWVCVFFPFEAVVLFPHCAKSNAEKMPTNL